MLTNNAFAKSEKSASDVLTKYNIKEAPIPIEFIIRKEGLQLIEFNLGDDISGTLIINESIGTIGINPKDNYPRQRFSMAHELGHYKLHIKPNKQNDLFVDYDFLVKYRDVRRDYSTTERKQEQEANAFAAALLMPANFINNEIKRFNTSLSEVEIIKKLAKKFKVSEVAMSYRLTNLNNFI